MQLNEVEFSDAKPITGYGPGFFRVQDEVFHSGILTSQMGTIPWHGYEDHSSLLALAGKIDVLFIGTGAEVAHIPQDLRDKLEDAGLGVDAMASPAAARTYNVLLSEGRRIALAMLPIE